MSWQAILADVLLGVAVLLVAACAIGVALARDASAKVHFAAPITMVAPVLVAAAVTLRSGWSEPTGQTWLAVAIVCIAGPVISHATVRAARVREHGDWRSPHGVVRAEDQQ